MILDVSENFRILRKEKGITQSEMAEIGGVSLATQQNYEAQRTQPTLEYLQKLAAVGIDVNYLLTGERRGETLSAEDSELLSIWHQAPLMLRNAALNVLLSGSGADQQQSKFSGIHQSGAGTQNIGDNNDNRQIYAELNQEADKIQNNDFRKSKIKKIKQ